jgi:DNA-directed RNA polymerase subunit RPC12/RpoP
MANFYCEYCGQKFSSVSSLTASTCSKHPLGSFKGKHKLYEGSEKAKYTCKYCGQSFSSISSMTAATCSKHPSGVFKGRHAPAL